MELTFVVRVRDVITDAERKENRPKTKSVRLYAFIVSFGVVSMLMDVVYQGALAVQGPLLASLGANALVIGIVSGLGEATALGGRLFSGPLADRSGRYWAFAIGGYATTALAVARHGLCRQPRGRVRARDRRAPLQLADDAFVPAIYAIAMAVDGAFAALIVAALHSGS